MTHVHFKPLIDCDLQDRPGLLQIAAPYEPRRSAVVYDTEGTAWGIVGEFKPSVRRSLKLPAFAAGFEIDPTFFMNIIPSQGYVPLPRFPKIEQDICLRIAAELTYAQVFDLVWRELAAACQEHMLPSLSPLDIYQRQDDADHKQITLRIGIASYERTLTDQEVAGVLANIARVAADELKAEQI